MTAQLRYSVACRAMVDPQGKVLLRGHGGRYSTEAGGPCPHCRRPMVLTGAIHVEHLPRG